MSLAEKQQQLLKMKEDLLRSLGLEENNDDFEKVASSAKLALRQGVTKRKADAADAAAAAPRRRSSRVSGISAAAEAPTLAPSEFPDFDPRRVRPTGDLPWYAVVHSTSSPAAAARLLNELRINTASLLGLPQPPQVLPPMSSSSAVASSSVVSLSSSTVPQQLVASGSTLCDDADETVAAASAAAPEPTSLPLPTTLAGTISAVEPKNDDGDSVIEVIEIEEPKQQASPRRRSSRSASAAATSALTSSSPSSRKLRKVEDGSSSSSSLTSNAAESVAAASTSSSTASAVAAGAPPAAAAAASEAVDLRIDAGMASPAVLAAHRTVGIWPASHVRPTSRLTGLRVASERSVMKVLPERIYSIGFHPGSARLLALGGDKWGHLGVWSPPADVAAGGSSTSSSSNSSPPSSSTSSSSAAAADTAPSVNSGTKRSRGGDDDDEDDDGDDDDDVVEVVSPSSKRAGSGRSAALDDGDNASVACFKLHTAPINYFQIPVGAPHLVLTASYDGSMRALDLNKGMSWELSTDCSSDECGGISSFDLDSVSSDGAAVLYAGTYGGLCAVVDTRLRRGAGASGESSVVTWSAHNKKVTALSLVKGSHSMLTSGSDGRVQLWDTRKLPSSGSSSSGSARITAVHELKHPQALSSAFFSPGGTHIVSTCNDNRLRVWSTVETKGVFLPTSVTPVTSIVHDNHTGRWLSQFRTVFDPANEDTFIVGSMSHHLEIYSVKSASRLAAISSPFITAVAPLVAVHPDPSIAAVVTGTASGRMYLYT